MFFLPCAEKYGDNEFHGGKTFKKTTLVVAIVVKKRTLGQISFIMQKQTDNPVLSMISCTVQKQMVQKCSKKKTDGECKNEGYATLSKGLSKKWKL